MGIGALGAALSGAAMPIVGAAGANQAGIAAGNQLNVNNLMDAAQLYRQQAQDALAKQTQQANIAHLGAETAAQEALAGSWKRAGTQYDPATGTEYDPETHTARQIAPGKVPAPVKPDDNWVTTDEKPVKLGGPTGFMQMDNTPIPATGVKRWVAPIKDSPSLQASEAAKQTAAEAWFNTPSTSPDVQQAQSAFKRMRAAHPAMPAQQIIRGLYDARTGGAKVGQEEASTGAAEARIAQQGGAPVAGPGLPANATPLRAGAAQQAPVDPAVDNGVQIAQGLVSARGDAAARALLESNTSLTAEQKKKIKQRMGWP